MGKSKADNRQDAAWIYNPWLDLIVGCGAWSAPLLLLTYFAGNSSTLAWSVGFYGLALLFNYPHYMATLYRAYHRAEDFQKYRVFTVHITALVLLTLAVSHFWSVTLPWIFTIYLTWSPWHYSGQNYGLFMMFARRAGAAPSIGERRALYLAFLLSYLILVLSFHTGASRDPLFVSLGLPGRFSLVALGMLSIGFVGCSIFGLSGLLRRGGWCPLLPSLTLFSTQFVWFLLPTALSVGERLQIPQSRYSTGVLAVMHSAQYLWITSYYARREAGAKGSSAWRPLAYFAVLIAGGIALFVPGPWLASRLFHYDFTSSFLIFTALVNIHHFILDGAIWKLRDGRIAALLLNSQERIADATSQAGSRVLAGLRWLVADSAPSRALRLSAALLLLTWATIDQARYYLALHEDNLGYLQRAATLNAYDSALQTRLGRQELEAGQTEAAASAWRQALQVNPANAAPRDALLNYLTAQQRWDEAYMLTEASLRYSPKDPNLLVNHGILASQLGHTEAALESWKKAISLDATQTRAYLYVASELDRQGKWEEAIPYYVGYLDQVVKGGVQNRPPAHDVIGIVLRLAQCQLQAKHLGPAEISYQLAQKIASQTGEKKLESLASSQQAGLAGAQRNIPKALGLYQHALELDKSLGDPRSEAADWYSYGLFLQDSGFPARLAYACLLKSESLMKAYADKAESAAIVQARGGMEKKLGGNAADVRGNLPYVLNEALALKVQ